MELLLRSGARVHGNASDALAERIRRERLEFRTHEQFVACAEDAELGGDRARGRGMVSRNHHDSNARAAAPRDRIARLRAWGILKTREAEQRERSLDILRRVCGQRSLGNREHAQRLRRELCHRLFESRARAGVERYRAVARAHEIAAAEDHLGRPLHICDGRSGPAAHHAHALAVRVEGQRADSRLRRLHVLTENPRLRRGYEQRDLGRVAGNAERLALRRDLGVIAGGSRPEEIARSLTPVALVLSQDLAGGAVPLAGHPEHDI